VIRKGVLHLAALLAVIIAWQGLAWAQGEDAGRLIGIWRSQLQTPWGSGFGETILFPNGTFSKSAKIGDLITRDVGKYTVGPGYIHFTIKDHEPKIYKGVPMHWVKSETVFFRFLGPDQLACEDRVMGSRWVAHRVRQ
jgi:hypothetical protein